jgi:Flp pilus assembly protein TadG
MMHPLDRISAGVVMTYFKTCRDRLESIADHLLRPITRPARPRREASPGQREIAGLRRHVRAFRADERGTIAIIMGFLLVPFLGAVGLGFEISNWYMTTRAMQNAADASALAAAINNGANYDVEAKAVAAQYGFINGTNNVSILVNNTALCPGGGNTCYSVTISGYTPLLLSEVVGFTGDATFNGTLEKQLSAVAVAKPSTKPQDLCMLALATSGAAQAIRTNGSPTGNMNGCDSMSNTAAQCNGSNLNLDISFAAGSNNGCGNSQIHQNVLSDPYYAQISANIAAFPPNPCASYPQESKHGNSYTVAASNQWSGSLNLSATTNYNFFCGDQELYADTTIQAPLGQAVIIIENGQLDLNGHKLTTLPNSAVTIVFTGTNGSGYSHSLTDNTNGPGGVLDITPSTTGSWAGIAVVQDPGLTSGVDVSAAGNSPTWDITGLIYMPHASITLKGAIDKSTNGKSCLVMVADNFQISGNGGILKTDIGQCAAAGLKMPQAIIPGGAQLVL